MARRRGLAILLASVVLHVVLVGVLAVLLPRDDGRRVETPLEVEVELSPSPPETAPPPSRDDVPAPRARVARASGPASPRRTKANRVPLASPAAPPAPAGAAPAIEPRDRFWSFRDEDDGAPQVPGPGLVGAPPPGAEAGAPARGEALAAETPLEPNARAVTGRGGVKMHLDSDGRIEGFSDPRPKWNGLGAEFDLNDVVMRLAGVDPYSYEKRRLAEATRDVRLCRMLEADRRLKQRALLALKDQLAAIVANGHMPDAEKRATLFELWDECLAAGDDEAGKLGAAARATILAAIRRQFPAGSAHAYTPVELASLNRRRSSRERFEPYAKDVDPLGR